MAQIVTMRDQVYNIIKLRIADGTYAHGMHLQELNLAEDLQVSRSPIREALKQLVAEELLVSSSNKGVYVRSFTRKEIYDIFDFRILLEGAAINFLKKNPQRIPKRELETVREHINNQIKGKIDYVMADATNPHYCIVQAMENDYITRQHLHASYCTMSFHGVLFEVAYEESVSAHLQLIEDILTQDFAKAKKTLRQHLLFSRDFICDTLI